MSNLPLFRRDAWTDGGEFVVSELTAATADRESYPHEEDERVDSYA